MLARSPLPTPATSPPIDTPDAQEPTLNRTFARRRTTALAAAWLAGLGLCAAAHAQTSLPDAVVHAAAVGPTEKQAITAWIDAQKSGLTSADAAAIRKSRNALVAPLRDRAATPSFRNEYSAQLVAIIRPLASSKSDESAINALRIAGDLATPASIDVLLAGLKDPRQPVRTMAALSIGGMFSVAAAQPTPSILPSKAFEVLTALETAFDSEKDPMVLDALLVALESAFRAPDATLEGVRARAIETLARAVGKRVQASTDAQAVRLSIRATNDLFGPLSDANKPPASALKESGGLAGDVVAMSIRRVELGNLSPAERAELTLAVDQAVRVYFAAHKALGGEPLQLRLGELLGAGKDQEFKADAARLIGGEGVLAKPPFGLPASRFAVKR